MKIRIVAFVCLIILIFNGICIAGCVNNQLPLTVPNNSDIVGTWVITDAFLANGDRCNATFIFKADGTGIRELISQTTGKIVLSENLTWKKTGDFDNVKITYEDGYEELVSLAWLKGTW